MKTEPQAPHEMVVPGIMLAVAGLFLANVDVDAIITAVIAILLL